MLTHVVLIKLKDRRPEAIAGLADRLESLAGNIPSLRHIEVGRDVLRSGRSFDLALIAHFDDLAGLDAYQRHPVHLPVAAVLREAADMVAVVDYES